MAKKKRPPKRLRPPQSQRRQPGRQTKMRPQPQTDDPTYRAGGKLQGKSAIITGGDSGIGEAVAIAFAKEGARVAIVYLNEHEDARRAAHRVRQYNRNVITIAGDIGDPDFCNAVVKQVRRTFKRIDVLVNNAAEQHVQDSLEKITDAQLERTFRTNLFSQFYLTRAALPHLKRGSAIINTTSVTAYRGSEHLIDYASTKGAIVAFTRSLAMSLATRGIRVNAVAPGPVWTPLIPASFKPQKVAKFGSDVPLGRAGEPSEIAPCYVFLASSDASYVTGQVLHPNGGEIVNA